MRRRRISLHYDIKHSSSTDKIWKEIRSDNDLAHNLERSDEKKSDIFIIERVPESLSSTPDGIARLQKSSGQIDLYPESSPRSIEVPVQVHFSANEGSKASERVPDGIKPALSTMTTRLEKIIS